MGDPVKLCEIGDTIVWRADNAVFFRAGMQIDADGAPNAYHPGTASRPKSGRPPGLDDLRNAGASGNWYGVVTDDGKRTGRPVVQGATDPYPGFYVSPTALQDATLRATNPRRYVDSTAVPYVVLPGRVARDPTSARFADATGLALGDLGMVFQRGESSHCVYADVGPRGRIGEGSIALRRRSHIDA